MKNEALTFRNRIQSQGGSYDHVTFSYRIAKSEGEYNKIILVATANEGCQSGASSWKGHFNLGLRVINFFVLFLKSIEYKRKRREGLSAMLRAKREKDYLAFAVRDFGEGRLSVHIFFSEHPAGHQRIFCRVSSDDVYVLNPGH